MENTECITNERNRTMSQTENVLDINKLIEVAQALVHNPQNHVARFGMNTLQDLQYGDRKMKLTVVIHGAKDEINVTPPRR